MRPKLVAVLLVAGTLGLWPGLALAGDPTGVWLTAKGESEIDIQPCGEALCGRIVRILKPNPDGPNLTYDENNPDPALRGQPILGITILFGLKPGEDENTWEGSVYNPNDGGTYDVTVKLKKDGDILKVEGCMAYVLCDSQKWTRVEPSQ